MSSNRPNDNPPTFNYNVSGGSATGISVQAKATAPVSSHATIWAQGGNSMPSHPHIPPSNVHPNPPNEAQGSAGISIRFGKGS